MRKVIVLLTILLSSSVVSAQRTEAAQVSQDDPDHLNFTIENGVISRPQDSIVTAGLDVTARFVGGEAAFMNYVSANFEYPVRCQEKGINGEVQLRFVVEIDGRISNVSVVKETKACPEFTAEAIRILKKSPRWIPAQLKGKSVRSYYTVPITLQLK
jgi:TonB family protein